MPSPALCGPQDSGLCRVCPRTAEPRPRAREARLWDVVPYYADGGDYGGTLRALAACFDSVYVSFYKGLGAVSDPRRGDGVKVRNVASRW